MSKVAYSVKPRDLRLSRSLMPCNSRVGLYADCMFYVGITYSSQKRPMSRDVEDIYEDIYEDIEDMDIDKDYLDF